MKFFSFKRNLSQAVALVFFVSVTLNIAACGSNSSVSSGNFTASTPNQNSSVWSSVSTAGYVQGGPWSNAQVLTINPTTETITLQVPFPAAPVGGVGVSIPVTEIPGATVSISEDTTGQWYFEFTMPLSYLVKGIAYQNPTTLPNGQPLPAIPAGELPSIAAHVTVGGSSTNFYVYGSVKYFAIFFPTPNFNPYVSLQFPIMNSANTEILGYFDTLADSTSTSNDAGLYLALVFPQDLQLLLDDLF